MARFKFLFYAAGIGLSYWYYGILQEKITRTKHVPDGATFTCTMTLVLLQCIVNSLFARFMLAYVYDQGVDRTKKNYYRICSLTYLIAMVSSNMALRHVNYPTQVVGKSCKPIPIMILGVLIGGKRYAIKKYLFILLIVLGVALFMYKREIILSGLFKMNENESSGIFNLIPALGIGEMLLILSLSMDGITGAIQERMKHEHATKSGHMMYKVNLYSTIYLIMATLYTGELLTFYEFIQKHPSLVTDIGLFSCLSAFGQLFIFLTVAEFGPLPCSVVTTTRKFFTVLTSVFLFGNRLTTTQWLGTSLVFLGLSLDAVYGKESPKLKHEEKKKKIK